jgi:hypothetical protein
VTELSKNFQDVSRQPLQYSLQQEGSFQVPLSDSGMSAIVFVLYVLGTAHGEPTWVPQATFDTAAQCEAARRVAKSKCVKKDDGYPAGAG